jgi:hypothetical protein
VASDELLLDPPVTAEPALVPSVPVLVLLELLGVLLGVLVAELLGVLVAELLGVLVLVAVPVDVSLVVVDASALAELLSFHTATPETAATATPAAPTAAVTARARRRPLSRMFIAPPLDRRRTGH